MLQAAGVFNDKISAATLFCIGHLPGQNARELFFRHSRPRQGALSLDAVIGRHDNHIIQLLLPACFEEKRDIQHHDGGALFLPTGDEVLLLFSDKGMDK